MSHVTVNAQRFDPYRNFKFRICWDGRTVAGVTKVSGLKRTTEIATATGASPARARHESITLARGVTHDPEFERWAHGLDAFSLDPAAELALQDIHKDLVLETYNEAGQLVLSYKIRRCWVSEYSAMPDLDANANAVAIEHMTVQNQGWVMEPPDS